MPYLVNYLFSDVVDSLASWRLISK